MSVAAAIILSLLAAEAPAPRAAQACDLRYERIVSFTAPQAQDRLTVELLGEACENALLVVQVFAENERRIFVTSLPVAALTIYEETPPQTPDAIARYVMLVDADHAWNASPTAAGDLPAEADERSDYLGFCLSTDAETYRRARRQNGPLLSLLLDPEYPSFLWFDPDAGRTVVLGYGCY
ncbi:MAG: hypothetical protein KIS81_02950 [Maricaulaceae bacterium]|nr:hypothetical protein [Maricaulaceae bacterium]